MIGYTNDKLLKMKPVYDSKKNQHAQMDTLIFFYDYAFRSDTTCSCVTSADSSFTLSMSAPIAASF